MTRDFVNYELPALHALCAPRTEGGALARGGLGKWGFFMLVTQRPERVRWCPQGTLGGFLRDS